jgi:hypothetical protein
MTSSKLLQPPTLNFGVAMVLGHMGDLMATNPHDVILQEVGVIMMGMFAKEMPTALSVGRMWLCACVLVFLWWVSTL